MAFMKVRMNNKYEINPDGQVRNVRTKEVVEHEYVGKNKVPYVRVVYAGKRKKEKVAKMLASAFLERGKDCTVLRCKDGNWANLSLDNYEWVDPRAVINDGKEWRKIYGYSKYYEVCEDGRIRSLITGELVSQLRRENGLNYVCLYNPAKKASRFYSVSKIVAIAFLKGPQHKFVTHLDGNKANDDYRNLAWGMSDATKRGLGMTPRAVDEYTEDGKFVKTWPSLTSASTTLKISYRSIYKCCIGKHKSAGNRVWRYHGEEFDKYPNPEAFEAIPGETFKLIEGSKSSYVSNMGRIINRSVYTREVKIYDNGNVNLTINGARTTRLAGKLVADEFLPNPKRKKRVGFKDGNVKNCNVNNLYWV